MATKLFLRNTALNGIGNYFDMLPTAGAGSATGVVNSAASGTQIQWTRTAGGTVLEFISGRVPSGGFTLSGTMTFSIWAHESNGQANCGARARVFKRAANGTETEIAGGPWNDGVEFGTSAGEMSWTGSPTSTAFAEDDRLIVRFYITNIGTMGGSRTCTLTYNAADAATGDSFFQINENVTFKAETATCTPVDEFQAQSMDAASVTPAIATAANDAFQGQSIDQPSISPTFVVSVNDCAQGQASDASAVAALAAASPADAAQAQMEDQPAMVSAVATVAADCGQDQVADEPTVAFTPLVAAADLAQAMGVDIPAIAAAVATAVSDMGQGQSADPPSVSAVAIVSAADIAQAQLLDVPAMAANAPTTVADAAQGQLEDAATAVPAVAAAPQDAAQGQAIDASAVVSRAAAAPTDVTQAQSADSPDASGSGTGAAEAGDLGQAQLADGAAIAALVATSVNDLLQGQTMEQPIMLYRGEAICPPSRWATAKREPRTAICSKRLPRRATRNLPPRGPRP